MESPTAALQPDDASLVARSLTGNKDAFGHIVSKYQSLVCSVAYSATGSITRSEDLAQETFLTAWRDLPALREPESLRPWLCGITRNLVHNSLRREGRDPSSNAEPIESASEAPTLEPLPTEQAISREEEAILWRSVGKVPETYREPLILFYREHQSVERVASSLGLSEDSVRQRLSRGRKLLHEQVLAFVEGALERSSPGESFTLGVVAALPGLSTSLAATAVATTAAKGTLLGKMAGSLVIFTSFFGLATSLLSSYASVRASLNVMRSPGERALFFRQLSEVVIGSVLFIAANLLLVLPRMFWFAHQTEVVVLGAAVSLTFTLWFTTRVWKFIQETRKVRIEEEKRHPELFADTRSKEGRRTFEYRSRWKLLGIPLVHVRYAPPPINAGPAFGWIAVGDRAVGVLFALGAVAAGGISVGSVSVGIIAVGAVSVGVVSLGSVSFGILTLGSFAIGVFAIGAFSFGWTIATGGVAVAKHLALGGLAIAKHPNDAVARAFGAQYHVDVVFYVLLAVVFILAVLPTTFLAWRTRRRGISLTTSQ